MNELQIKYKNEIEELVEACHRLAALGYVTSSGGNLSYRLEENLILITPTKTPKRRMRFEDICFIDADGNVVYAPAGKKPTGETPFHVRIMCMRPDVRAIVHAHPPILTGFAIAGTDLMERPFLPEPILEVGPMLNVAYATPLSEELSENFDAVIHKSNGFLMQNHGALVCNVNEITEAVEHMEMMEAMAQSICVAKVLGKANEIAPERIRALDEVIAVRNLKLPGTEVTSLAELYK